MQHRARPLTAIVTGSDSGIGRAVAVALAGGGVDVGVTYHSDERGAEDTAKEVREEGVTAVVRQLDLTDRPTAGAVIDELAEELGSVDILVNCSGTRELAMDMDFDTWRQVLSVDLDGAFVCSQRAAKRMIAVAFLATPAAAYVTGASLVVDGGMLLMGPQAGSHLTTDDWRRP